MARKDLNSCWIYNKIEGKCTITYSIPEKRQLEVMNCDESIVENLHQKMNNFSLPVGQEIQKISPFILNGGTVCVFNLKASGLLFFYSSKRSTFTQLEINQLSPIVEKFSYSLEASDAFTKQEKLLRNLEKQNQELNDYAHVVSHDLKSPLRNIETLVSWVKQDYKNLIDEKGIKTLNLVSENLEKMDNLIDDILIHSTIEKKSTEIHTLDLSDLVSNTISAMGIPDHVTIKIDKSLPIIQGNSFMMQQLFQNLIDNAIKYNDKPNCEIEIGARTINKGHEYYVKDNGIGIEKKYFFKIFETFQRLSNNPKSSGIGLSIVKKIVQNNGGNIWVESEVNFGTTFYFTLFNT
ncbi:sensor histidine kinase [Algoriphagus pacificus]|uniref:histidine kinase n=1 Tax=Algoriphagus pacificus TaxID=2811234 RepID=A0ABS3CMH9_9BACT|nr:ATP-binding protein [Algoriphagus pacificus]MBN7817691.1 GHKL domain-containing protein [Algoriphagus pacificus]